MISPFENAGLFLVQTLFNLYLFVLLIRLILHFQRADYYNPVIQLVIKLTAPLIKPLNKFIPDIKGVELSTIFVLLVVEAIKLLCIIGLQGGGFPNFLGLLIWAVADIVNQLINLYFFAIIIRVILSWLGRGVVNPLTSILYLITEPLMAPAKRLVPAIGGFDLSPLVVLILLQLTLIILVKPLLGLGVTIAL